MIALTTSGKSSSASFLLHRTRFGSKVSVSDQIDVIVRLQKTTNGNSLLRRATKIMGLSGNTTMRKEMIHMKMHRILETDVDKVNGIVKNT